MMKRHILSLIAVSVVGIFLFYGSWLVSNFIERGNKEFLLSPIITGHEGELLPNINLLLPDSISNVNIATAPSGSPIVLFYFGPDCPYCQSEMNEIISNIHKLSDMRFYLITPYRFSEMKNFYDKYNLKLYNNIIIGMDYKFKFGDYFSTRSIPYLAIYDTNRRLKVAYSGIIKYDQLVSVNSR